MRIPSQPVSVIAPASGHAASEHSSSSVNSTGTLRRSLPSGSLQAVLDESAINSTGILAQDRWTFRGGPEATHPHPGKRPNDHRGISHKLRRDLQLLRRLPLLGDKAMELMEENPDTPFDMLSQVTLGRISEEGLSHLVHGDMARWIIKRKNPAQRDPAIRVSDWIERPKHHGPSRFQQEFLKQQQVTPEPAESMDALQLAFSKLKLND